MTNEISQFAYFIGYDKKPQFFHKMVVLLGIKSVHFLKLGINVMSEL